MYQYKHRNLSPYLQKENNRQMLNSQLKYTQQGSLKESSSTYYPQKSNPNLLQVKLQSKALQLIKRIQGQHFQTSVLTQQTQSLMKMCDSQKSFIQSINIDMMRQQYEEELMQLTKEKQTLEGFMQAIKNQRNIQQLEQQSKIDMIRDDNRLLADKITQQLQNKQQYLLKHKDVKTKRQDMEKQIFMQQQRIDQLRHIQRKVNISHKELQQLKTKSYQ